MLYDMSQRSSPACCHHFLVQIADDLRVALVINPLERLCPKRRASSRRRPPGLKFQALKASGEKYAGTRMAFARIRTTCCLVIIRASSFSSNLIVSKRCLAI
jgi:hypothetical protein